MTPLTPAEVEALNVAAGVLRRVAQESETYETCIAVRRDGRVEAYGLSGGLSQWSVRADLVAGPPLGVAMKGVCG